jgi:hypothetical protein
MKQSDMHYLSFLAQFFLELKTYQTNILHKIKLLPLCSKLSPEKRVLFEIMWKNMVQSDGADENMAHAHCVLDT